MTGDDAKTVGAILYHLIDEYEFTRLQNQIFSGCVVDSEDRRYVWSNVANCLGIDEDSSTVPVIEDFKIHELGEYSNKKGITVHNYQKIYNLNAIQDDDSSLPEHQYGFTLDDGKHVVFDFVPYFAILQELAKEEKKEGVVFEAELEGGKYKLVFDYLSFREEEGKVSAIFSFDGYLLEK